MRQLNAKQKKLLDQFIGDYIKGSGGQYPRDIEAINPWLWSEIETLGDHETIYQNAERYVHDQILTGKYKTWGL